MLRVITEMAVKILQVNLGRGREAQELMKRSANEKGADIVIISEQYARIENEMWYQDVSGKASVYVRNPLITINNIEENNEGFVVIHTKGVRIYSCYYSPNMDFIEFQTRIAKLEENVKAGSTPVLIGGDFNSKSPEWHSPITDKRGIAVSEMIASLNLIVLNRGNSPTFRRGDSSSIIDITTASVSIAAKTSQWEVLEDETLSDHQYIMMNIHPYPTISTNPTRTRWNTRQINVERCEETLGNIGNRVQQSDDADQAVSCLIDTLTEICNAGMSRTQNLGKSRKHVYWWNDGIASLRCECHRTKRVSTRKRGDLEAMETYRKARKRLRLAIKESKRNAWETLCQEVNNDPWGLPYRIVMKKLGNRKKIPGITRPDWALTIVSSLFPETESVRGGFPPIEGARESDLFTPIEVRDVCRNLKKRKAPGPDGIPNEIISLVGEIRPDIFTRTFNLCMKKGVFPKIWKKQYLVLLRKGDKPLDNPSSYRPLCLLDTCGKVLEKLLVNRLEMEISRCGGLSPMQFGFVKRKSTVDAIQVVVNTAKEAREHLRFCAIVTLDIKNAFNTADWNVIRQTIRDRNFSGYLVQMIDSYLENRILEYETDDGIKQFEVSAGVPQGSILGPFLWNIMYDGLLNLALPGGSKLVGYADDVALIVDQPSAPLTEIITNDCLGRIHRWLNSRNLALAAAKTEAIIVTKRRSFEYPKLRVDGYEIPISTNLKYLGIVLDSRLSFKDHVEMVAKKALGTSTKLARIMPNIKGPGQSTRRLIATVAYAQVLYAAPVISDTVSRSQLLKKDLEKVHRTCTLRVTSAYRTISTSAASVLAGLPPIELLLQERKDIYEEKRSISNPDMEKTRIKMEARLRLLRKWQSLWDESNKGRWTYELIPDVKMFVNRSFGELNFYLTQIFSGHGNFGKYLQRFRIRPDGVCEVCHEGEDDVEHTIINCSRWENGRDTWSEDIQVNRTMKNLVTQMLESPENWSRYSESMVRIMKEKITYQRNHAPNP